MTCKAFTKVGSCKPLKYFIVNHYSRMLSTCWIHDWISFSWICYSFWIQLNVLNITQPSTSQIPENRPSLFFPFHSLSASTKGFLMHKTIPLSRTHRITTCSSCKLPRPSPPHTCTIKIILIHLRGSLQRESLFFYWGLNKKSFNRIYYSGA